MVLGHGKNIAVSVTNLTLGGSLAGLTTMMITWIKPRIEHFWKYKVKKHGRSRKVQVRQYWSFLVLVDATL